MESDLTPEEKFNAEAPERLVARALREGRSREEIIAELDRFDWAPEAASALIVRVARDIVQFRSSPEGRAALLNDCRKQMVAGFIVAVLGGLGAVVAFWLFGLLGLIASFGAVLAGTIIGTRGYTRWRLFSCEFSPEKK